MSVNEAIAWLENIGRVPNSYWDVAAMLREAKEIIKHASNEPDSPMAESMVERAERWLKE